MTNGSSFLFSGIRLDRKRFGGDIARFEKKEKNHSVEVSSSVEIEKAEPVDGKSPAKKRKRKGVVSELSILCWMNLISFFELGLFEQIDSVIQVCSNPSIIRSLFSATLPDFVEDHARELMHDAIRVIVDRKNMASETIKQKLVFTGSEEGKLMAIRQSFAEFTSPSTGLCPKQGASKRTLW